MVEMGALLEKQNEGRMYVFGAYMLILDDAFDGPFVVSLYFTIPDAMSMTILLSNLMGVLVLWNPF